jgi:DNA-binding PadR family transcriptional regulator
MIVNDLDFCVAAVICRDGPISAYRVREDFRQSMTSTWSSSAGTIYPVIERLVGAGYVAATETGDARGTQLLTITDAGLQALHEWLVDVPEAAAAPTADATRNRIQFTEILGPEAAARMVGNAIAASEAYLFRMTEKLPAKAEANWHIYLASVGATMQVKARLDWLRLVEAGLKSGTPAARRRFMKRIEEHLRPR